eukprot:10931728-Prorocentrum_lima.AAC.1
MARLPRCRGKKMRSFTGILVETFFAPGGVFCCRFGVIRHAIYETPGAAASMDCCWLLLGLCVPGGEQLDAACFVRVSWVCRAPRLLLPRL